MDFEELICSICKQHFDSDGHLPRMIPKCGHTYCTQCIVDIIQSRSTSSDYLFCCPDDNFIIRLKNRDITSFPINFLLASLVGKKAHVMNSKTLQTAEKDEYIPNAKKHSSSRSLSTTGSPDNDESSIHSIKPHEKKSFNKCSEHGKELEIVCVQDQCRICSSCALFGAHKNHDIKPEGEILTEVAARAESIVDLFQKIQKQEEAILENQNASYIQKKLSERQNELAIMIKDKFKEYITILKTQERCLLAELDEKFKDIRERIIQGKKISQELIDRTNKWKASAEKTLTIMSEKSEKGDIAYELLKKTDNPKEDIVLIGQNVMYELYKTKEKMLRKLDGQEMEICVSFNDNFLKPTDFLCQITSSIEGLSRRFENSLNSCASHSMMPEINLCKRNEVASEDEIPVRLNETQYSQLHPSTNFGKFLDNRKSNDTDLLSFELKDLNIAELAESNHLARFAQPEASETRDLESSRARASKKRERASRGFEGSEALANITNRSISNASNVKREGKQVSTRKADDSYISVSRDTSRSQKRSVSPLKRGESYERLPKSSRSRKNKEIQVSEKYEPILEGIMLNIIDSADLTGAELGDIGIQKLAEYLKANTKLRSLKLLKNKITDEGGSILADALAYNRTLQTLNLTQNLLTEKTVDAFMELVKTRKNIKSIYFNQNPISLRNVKTKIREMEILGVSVSI